jgi:hypothetical protein
MSSTNIFHKVTKQNIGNVEEVVYAAPAGQTCLLISLNLSNKLNTGITVTVTLEDQVTSENINLLTDVPLPQGSSLPALGRQKIIISDGDLIKVTASEPDAIDAVLSVIEDIN